MKSNIFNIIKIIIISVGIVLISSTTSHAMLNAVITDGQDWINKGKNENQTVDLSDLKDTSNDIYNILQNIGIATSLIVGMILGIKIFIATAEEKAQLKESLTPYLAGCAVMFGAFTIWKIVLTVLGNLE